MPERRIKLQTFRTRPRCCTDVVGIIYAVGGLTSCGDSISTVECFDPVVRKWQISKPMKTLRSRVGVTVLKGLSCFERKNVMICYAQIQCIMLLFIGILFCFYKFFKVLKIFLSIFCGLFNLWVPFNISFICNLCLINL